MIIEFVNPKDVELCNTYKDHIFKVDILRNWIDKYCKEWITTIYLPKQEKVSDKELRELNPDNLGTIADIIGMFVSGDHPCDFNGTVVITDKILKNDTFNIFIEDNIELIKNEIREFENPDEKIIIQENRSNVKFYDIYFSDPRSYDVGGIRFKTRINTTGTIFIEDMLALDTVKFYNVMEEKMKVKELEKFKKEISDYEPPVDVKSTTIASVTDERIKECINDPHLVELIVFIRDKVINNDDFPILKTYDRNSCIQYIIQEKAYPENLEKDIDTISEIANELEGLCCTALIRDDGQVNYTNIRYLKNLTDLSVHPGETDSFGWLSGVLVTPKCNIVYG